MICGVGEMEDILKLWDKHMAALSEGFVYRYSQITGPQYALAEINTLLNTYGLNLQKVKLPVTSLVIAVSNMPAFDIVEEQTKAQLKTDKLNAEQLLVVDTVLNAIYGNQIDTPKLFFLCGPAGTGKLSFIPLHYIQTKEKELLQLY